MKAGRTPAQDDVKEDIRMKSGKRPKKKATGAKRTSRKRPGQRSPDVELDSHTVSALLSELSKHSGASPADTGGDVDADWQRSQSAGEEAVGGTVATPDQDVVDDLARPLGVERAADDQVISSEEILRGRDRRRWRTERTIDESDRDEQA